MSLLGKLFSSTNKNTVKELTAEQCFDEGMRLSNVGDDCSACRSFQEAVAKGANYAAYNVAVCYSRLGDHHMAGKWANQAVEAGDEDAINLQRGYKSIDDMARLSIAGDVEKVTFHMALPDFSDNTIEMCQRIISATDALYYPTTEDLDTEREQYCNIALCKYLNRDGNVTEEEAIFIDNLFDKGKIEDGTNDLRHVVICLFNLNDLKKKTGDLKYQEKAYKLACKAHDFGCYINGKDPDYKFDVLDVILREKINAKVCPRDLASARILNREMLLLGSERATARYREIAEVLD